MMLSTGSLTLDIAALAIGYFLVNYLVRRTQRIPNGLRLPPGPRGKPTHHDWETVTRWGEQYGDLVYVKVLGIPMVFVNSLEAARELFERRSSLYADRPDLPMMMMSGWDFNFAFMRYGSRWRRHRRAFHQHFNLKAVEAYHPVQMKHVRALLRRIHDSTENYVEHLKHLAAAIIMEAVYGIKLQPKGDRYIGFAHLALQGASEATVPGAFFVDLLPILKYVPERMPGAIFKKKARMWRKPTLEMVVAPYMAVKNALATGTAGPSVMASCLTALSRDDHALPDEEEIVRDTCGVSYAAGAGTSVAGLISFILAMVLYPEAQRKAQAELDVVIGVDHLPTMEDRGRLPYVNALCEEDEVYNGYFIPKGSLVVGNAWAILHNEATYGPRPDEFEPERFLRPGINVPTAQFGFGRRICPGRYLAENTLFIVVASMLKVFDISPAKDGNGDGIPVSGLYTGSGFVPEPEPFQCSIQPRSASVQNLKVFLEQASLDE